MTRWSFRGLRSKKSAYCLVALVALVLPCTALAAEASPQVELNRSWILVAAALVFFMQTGFLALEAGFVQPHNATVTAYKNLIDWCIVSLIWYLVGWGLTFGHTVGGLVGSGGLLGSNIGDPQGNGFDYTYFLFQLAFAGTAVTIVSGAMAERISFVTYLLVAVFTGSVTYPVFAHWVWGNGYYQQSTLLNGIGFVDFAGSTAVHSLAGWVCLVGVVVVGPRLGRFAADGTPRSLEANNIILSTLGTLILWLGWWGFNGGSTLFSGESAAKVIIATNLAGAAGGLFGYLHGYFFQKRQDLEAKLLGGILGGLVAVTGSSNLVGPARAILIGILAAVVHNYVYTLLLKLRLDDPVGAIPVHLGCGILGTLCVGFLGDQELLPNPRLTQIGIQLVGTLACAVWSGGVSLLLFLALKATVGLRVSPLEETRGITLSGLHADNDHDLTSDELRELMG